MSRTERPYDRDMRMIWVGLVLAACSTSSETIKRKTGGAAGIEGAKAAEPPLRVEVGDCALPASSFVSGARPMPFAFETSDVKPAAEGPAIAVLGGGSGFESGDINTSIYSPFSGSQISGGAFAVLDPGGSGVGGGRAAGTGGEGAVERRTEPTGITSIEQPDVQGELDQAIVRRYMRRNQQRIQSRHTNSRGRSQD